MRIKGVTDEDFVNYKLPSMFIITSYCTFKCDIECGKPVCQNSELAKQRSREIDDDTLIERYISNPITHAIVFGGLEPFDQFEELWNFISAFRFRYGRKDTIVIYTGYNEAEIEHETALLCTFDNIIIKYGRFVPNSEPVFDEVLGVNLASKNQHAVMLEKSCEV